MAGRTCTAVLALLTLAAAGAWADTPPGPPAPGPGPALTTALDLLTQKLACTEDHRDRDGNPPLHRHDTCTFSYDLATYTATYVQQSEVYKIRRGGAEEFASREEVTSVFSLLKVRSAGPGLRSAVQVMAEPAADFTEKPIFCTTVTTKGTADPVTDEIRVEGLMMRTADQETAAEVVGAWRQVIALCKGVVVPEAPPAAPMTLEEALQWLSDNLNYKATRQGQYIERFTRGFSYDLQKGELVCTHERDVVMPLKNGKEKPISYGAWTFTVPLARISGTSGGGPEGPKTSTGICWPGGVVVYAVEVINDVHVPRITMHEVRRNHGGQPTEKTTKEYFASFQFQTGDRLQQGLKVWKRVVELCKGQAGYTETPTDEGGATAPPIAP
jgi:hypothetical protein